MYLLTRIQIRFTALFGTPKIHWLKQARHPEHPEIVLVTNIKEEGQHIGIHNAGLFWHSDLSYTEEPDRGGFLFAVEVPQKDGRPCGDTLFASTSAAYDALDDATKRTLAGLSAVFSVDQRNAKLRDAGDPRAAPTKLQSTDTSAVHKIIRTHPVTGRKCLYVSEGHTSHIVGMEPSDSDALLSRLFEHLANPRFIYRHQWRVGDLVMWDNVPTQHLATFDYELPQRRLLHRTTIEGDRPY